MLLGGVPGVQRGRVVILGGGVVGTHAAKMAVGLGADVSDARAVAAALAELDDLFGGRVQTLYSNEANLAREPRAGRPGDRRGARCPARAAPKLIRREHLRTCCRAR